jgi:hypothetical protein
MGDRTLIRLGLERGDRAFRCGYRRSHFDLMRDGKVRLSKDYEFYQQTSESFIYLALIRKMLGNLIVGNS